MFKIFNFDFRRHVASVPNGKQEPEVNEANQDVMKQSKIVKSTIEQRTKKCNLNKLFLAIDPEIQTAMKNLEVRLNSKNDYKKSGNYPGKNESPSKELH
jgi:hypothetical protein